MGVLKGNEVTWEEAEKEMNLILTEHWSSQESKFKLNISQPLFRGQANSDWELNTTLDRILYKRFMSVKEYHFILKQILNEASSWSKKRWEIDEDGDFVKVSSFLEHLSHMPQKTYEFMTYLRHHGFPSPLLDWTHSPYVAAFFAFRNIPLEAKTVSIFIYRQDRITMSEVGKPYLTVLGTNVYTHYRHFRQQCEYSLCVQLAGDGEFIYKPHQSAFTEGIEEQDKMVELRISVTERDKVMRKLISMNINSASLFESEDGFIQGLAEKSFF